MKRSKKILIERYVNLRCKRLMDEYSQQPLKEQYWNFLGMEIPTWNQAKKNVSANWDKVTSQPILNTVRDIGNFYSNVPVVGKVPGVVGGTIDAIQGVASGDKGQATDGLLNIAFSGMGGGPGAAIKNTVKGAIGDTVNKQVKNVVADTAKINVKNISKDNLNPGQNTNTNTNVVTAGPNSGGGGSNQVAVNTPTANTNQVAVNTPTGGTDLESMKKGEYIPYSQRGT